MKSFKLVVTGTGILMCILLATIFQKETRQVPIKPASTTTMSSRSTTGEGDVLITGHAISYQVGLSY